MMGRAHTRIPWTIGIYKERECRPRTIVSGVRAAPGGEAERKKSIGGDTVKSHQERTYKFISVMVGDLKGYEDALRALYRKDHKAFALHAGDWPADVKAHALKLAKPVFEAGAK